MERNVAELEPTLHGPRRRQRVGLGANRGPHLEERDQVGEEQSLIGNAREGREDLLNIRACLKNRPGKECELTDGKQAPHGSPDHEDVGGVVTSGPDNR